MARGKLVQEPFVFEAVVGQQYALSYIIGELHVEFVDDVEDTIGTNRNALVWDTDANAALMEWGKREVNKIAREWANKRGEDNRRLLEQNQSYQDFKKRASDTGNRRALKLADQLGTSVDRKKSHRFRDGTGANHPDVFGLLGIRCLFGDSGGTGRGGTWRMRG